MRLTSQVLHFGSKKRGHYITEVLVGNKYFCVDDHRVFEVEAWSRNAYLLVYSRDGSDADMDMLLTLANQFDLIPPQAPDFEAESVQHHPRRYHVMLMESERCANFV